MRFSWPTRLGIFQLLIACLLVALFTCPGEAHGPMIILKGSSRGHHHGGGGLGGMGAVGLLAAGVAVKMIHEFVKNHHGGFGGSGGNSVLFPGQVMGQVHSFASHDAHLPDYGYTPQEHGHWP